MTPGAPGRKFRSYDSASEGGWITLLHAGVLLLGKTSPALKGWHAAEKRVRARAK